jgi:7-cyano-7-deazaguanine synthase
MVSGGVDSAVLIAEMLKNYSRVYPVYMQCGLRWETAELYWLRQYLTAVHTNALQPLTILQLPVQDIYGEHWSLSGQSIPDSASEDAAVYLPGRNILLAGKAAVFCQQHHIPAIALATLAGNPFPDATKKFWADYANILTCALGTSIKILTPFATLSKIDVLQCGKHLPLHLTFSCLDPLETTPCGHCNKCEEKRLAFDKANISDDISK